MEKEKKEGRYGSALIIVVSVMAFIMSIAATMAYTSSLFQDFALQRIGIEKNYRAMESLLYYGIAKCYESSNKDKKDEDDGIIVFESWPMHNDGYKAKLHISGGEEDYTIQAALKKNERIVSKGSAQLFLKKEIWYIGQWSIT